YTSFIVNTFIYYNKGNPWKSQPKMKNSFDENIQKNAGKIYKLPRAKCRIGKIYKCIIMGDYHENSGIS
ncbi:MAG: hypothetical protein LUE96_05735, partial [Lachnospiraceae bacterium]|nr:hypothetical protein [Lachnospiraceae bacterium]